MNNYIKYSHEALCLLLEHKDCEIDRLTAQLDASRALLAERDDVLSARFNENKELYMHWQQALTETTTLRTKLAECEKEMERLKESEEVLTDCLNGSSKAKYTAELYDKGVADARKQVARDIVDMLRGAPNGFYIANIIKQRYGLEG